jgi:hypothetical protein
VPEARTAEKLRRQALRQKLKMENDEKNVGEPIPKLNVTRVRGITITEYCQ